MHVISNKEKIGKPMRVIYGSFYNDCTISVMYDLQLGTSHCGVKVR